MKELQSVAFEINNNCPRAVTHPLCPINDVGRYTHGRQDTVLDDDTILGFWRWLRSRGFTGSVNWSIYNEPALVMGRIRLLMVEMLSVAPDQQFHLWTATSIDATGFAFVHRSVYSSASPTPLDERMRVVSGEGSFPQHAGRCQRSWGRELAIDYHGNVLLCCMDWRCEESTGNLFNGDWEALMLRHKVKAEVAWNDAESWNRLPRLCRACVTHNSYAHQV